jgi:hypothetical protein
MAIDITNQNFLNPTGFLVTINRLPNVSFWCNAVTLPGISVANPQQANPFSKLPVPGDFADIDSLSIEFAVDEDMKNWLEIMRWFIGLTFPEDYAQFSFGILDPTGDVPGTLNNLYSEISVTVLSSHKNPIATFIYHDCIPQTISGIDMSVVTQDIETVPCTATFDFSHFTVVKPGTDTAIA